MGARVTASVIDGNTSVNETTDQEGRFELRPPRGTRVDLLVQPLLPPEEGREAWNSFDEDPKHTTRREDVASDASDLQLVLPTVD